MSNTEIFKKINSLVTLLSRTAGRDKICRIFQYGSLLLAELTQQKAANTKQVLPNKFLRISNEMRMVRKIIRFLRTMQYTRKVIQAIKKIKSKNMDLYDLAITITQGASALFTFLFFIFDHRVCLAEIGFISKDNLKTNFQKSYKFWFLQCFFSFARDILQFVNMILIGKSGMQPQQLLLDAIKNLFDLLIALSGLRGSPFSKKAIGFFGFGTSLIGTYQLWK